MIEEIFDAVGLHKEINVMSKPMANDKSEIANLDNNASLDSLHAWLTESINSQLAGGVETK
ncbi:hypothetical protein ACW6AV_003460 [Edwardsiella piscicida]|uniref:hypothetical protein n=2 Tax=Hafniaceae TaxID=1903412 RepID=UPI000B29FBD9|nr:hypothetical protein [Edwardsiella ictaluri]NJS89690.1 hypothetical protein [Escherichia coli]EKS7789764.1 hypothetical protein [Edwardsiella ictaluri]EKS7817137.1 hypothetical protein [Edwardsiella ictaluri]EKS7820635.1 hypothetical protein [Edwardsiella ictaluri]